MRALVLPGDVRFNFGDTAICLALVRLVRDVVPGCAMSVWARPPLLPGGFEDVRFLGGFGPAVLRAIVRSDAALWGGGQLLAGHRSRVKVPYWALRIGLVRALGTRVVGLGQGVGPLPHPLDRALAWRLAHATRAFGVRDAGSRKLLGEIGVPAARIRLAADPALLLGPERFPRPPANRRPRIGLSARYTGHHRAGRIVPFQLRGESARRAVLASAEYRAWADRLVAAVNRWIDELDAEIVLFPMYVAPWETDGPLAEGIAARAAAPDRVRIFRPRTSVAELLVELESLDAFVGVPMHATILAASRGVPTLGLPYERKGAEFLERVGQAAHVLPAEELARPGGDEALAERFRALWSGRAAVRAALALEIPKVRAAAGESRALVREAFGLAPEPERHSV